ncbi:Serine/threonine-protein phosphatase 7, partial [Tetrabaena socialis]
MGLFRRPPEPKRGAKRRKPSQPARGGPGGGSALVPGSLEDLRRATKGGMDPDGCGTSLLATDVLWSDPVAEPGFSENEARGVGLVFGPDVTEAFLTANRLRLILRSHEGPDARDKRSDLPQVLQGWSLDHDTP